VVTEILVSDGGGLGPRALLLTLGLVSDLVGGRGPVFPSILEVGTGLLVGGFTFG